MNENSISDPLFEAMVAYYEHKLSQEQADELLEWIEQSSENLAYFREISTIWYASGMIGKDEKNTHQSWMNLVQKIKKNETRRMPESVTWIRLTTIYKFAASILLIITIGTVSIIALKNRIHPSGEKYFEAVAPKGSRSVITLLDGSIIWLNSGTTLRYTADFDKSSRNVILEGEAFFNVAENEEIPFIVKTPKIWITALGTSFNVKAYGDENFIETTLETGELKIDCINKGGRISSFKPIFLKPNQKAVFMKSSGDLSLSNQNQASPIEKSETITKTKSLQIRIDTLVDTKLTTSWKDSRWIFKSERLSKLVPILERRYDVAITIMDSVLINYKFTGILKEESLRQVLYALTLTAPIKFEVSKKNVYLFENHEHRNKYERQMQ